MGTDNFNMASMIVSAIRDRRECYLRNMEMSERYEVNSDKYNAHISIANDAMREVVQFEAVKTAYENGSLYFGITKEGTRCG